MRTLACLLTLLFVMLVPAVVQADNAPADAPANERDHVDGAHQVLVMLRIPPPHFRPDAMYGGHYADDAGAGARRRIAEDLASRHGLKVLSGWPMSIIQLDCYVLDVPPDQPLEDAVVALSKDPRVEWAEPIRQYRGMEHDDPLYPAQPAARDWHLSALHRVSTGHGVKVAVVDSGVDTQHPDLAGQILATENFVDGMPYKAEAHGTGVAGIIAARADNHQGIVGIAPGARLMALRACWQAPQATQCNSFTLAKALNFAIMHDAHIINLSLTGPDDRLLEKLLDEALARGIAVVGAVDDQNERGGFPASYPGVIAVAARETPGRILPQALRAPGKDIPTTAVSARWALVSGSSYAAAHISGMLALMAEKYPAMKPRHLRHKIALYPDNAFPGASAGEVDACLTLRPVAAQCVCNCSVLNAHR